MLMARQVHGSAVCLAWLHWLHSLNSSVEETALWSYSCTSRCVGVQDPNVCMCMCVRVGLCAAGKVYALKQMSKAHIIDNKLVAHVHREKNVSLSSTAPLDAVHVGGWVWGS